MVNPATTIYDLPKDMHRMISSYLNDKDLRRLHQTSNYFKQVALEELTSRVFSKIHQDLLAFEDLVKTPHSKKAAFKNLFSNLKILNGNTNYEIQSFLSQNSQDLNPKMIQQILELFADPLYREVQECKNLLKDMILANTCSSSQIIQTGNHFTFDYSLKLLNILIAHAPSSEKLRGLLALAALEKGCFDSLESLLTEGPITDQDQDFLMMEATAQGNLELLDWFINLWNISGQRIAQCLKSAAKKGHLPIIEYLFSKAEIEGYIISEALQGAALQGQIEVVDFFFNYLAIPQEIRGIAVRAAAVNGHLVIVQKLLENASILEIDRELAIKDAALNNHELVFEFLLNLGPVSEAVAGTIVKSLITSKHTSILERFLKDAPLSIEDRTSAFVLAIIRKLDQTAKLLILSGPLPEKAQQIVMDFSTKEQKQALMQQLLETSNK